MFIYKILITFGLIFVSSTQLNAQVYTFQNAKKSHFEVVTSENDSIKKRISQAAFDFKKFDSYRLLNTRRAIPVEGYDAKIVLHSAQELLEKYGKEVSPFTILPEHEYPEVVLFFTENKFPEFSIKKVE